MSIPPKSGFIDISPQAEQTKLDPDGSKLKRTSSVHNSAIFTTSSTPRKKNTRDKNRTVSMQAVKGPATQKSALENQKTTSKPRSVPSQVQLSHSDKTEPEEQQVVIESVPVEKDSKDDEEEVIVKPIPIIEKSPTAISKTPTVDEVLDEEDVPKKRRSPSGGYYLECFLREVLTNMRHNPMMSVASVSTVMILALILGFFVLIIANLESLADELAGEMQIKVYMSQNFDPKQINSFKSAAYDIGHVTKVTFVPKDEAFKKLRKRLNAKLDLDDLESNPLPDAFEIPVDDPSFLEPVAHKLAQIDNVATVDYGREEAQKLMKLNHIIRMVGLIILIMLFASSLLIISNTIRLTVFARRKEIDIMQLVGAADWFIRWPFILEGVTQGVIGAAMASVLIDVSYRVVVPQLQKSISFLPILLPGAIMPYLNIGLITMGCLVGALGSLISVNRYLKA